MRFWAENYEQILKEISLGLMYAGKDIRIFIVESLLPGSHFTGCWVRPLIILTLDEIHHQHKPIATRIK